MNEDNKIKVLYVINDLSVGGAETVVMNYMRELSVDADIEPSLLLLGNQTNFIYDIEALKSNFNVYYSGFVKKYYPIKGINFIRLQLCIIKTLKQLDPDIIHTHETGYLKKEIIPIVLKHKAIRVHTLHGTPSLYKYSNFLVAKLAFNVFHFYPICITKEQAERAVKQYGFNNYSLIRNGIDISRYSISELKSSIRESLGIENNDFVIGTVAGLRPIKNLDFMLKLFSEYIKENANAKLLIVGDGEEREHLEQLADNLSINNEIIFLGTRSDVERIYKAMDVFIMTSFSEASPIVFVEAQLSGCRCVVSSAVPPSNVFTDKVNILSLDDSIERWISAINGDELYEEIRCSADDFKMENFINSTKNLYRELLDKHK